MLVSGAITMSDDLSSRYYLDLACAFIRGKLPDAPDLPPEDLFRHGESAGLRLHKFKRSTLLPRIRRVFGLLHNLAPEHLLDVGSGRGVFLWPLLDTFADLRVTCIDQREDRVADLRAVAAGGISTLDAAVMDATALDFSENAFDGVTLLEVLEHIPQPQLAVAEAVRVARRFVAVSVPSKPDDNPEHLHLFDGRSLSALFHQAGVNRVSVDHVLNHIVALAMVDRS
jgi:ubiquinone/menaquinone biosynthesis C-methylase UbiE